MTNAEAVLIGSQVAINKGPNRPYKVLEAKKNRVVVSDGLTRKKHLHTDDVLPWVRVSGLTKKARINFSALSKLEFKKEVKKKAEIEEMIRDYLGSDEQSKDMALMVELFENGVPLEVAAASSPYQESDIKHIYSGGELKELQNGGPPGGTVRYGLMVGTSRPIEDIIKRGKNIDQNSKVLVQWWHHEYSVNDYRPEIERIEVEELSEGRFVERTYRGVSNMGEFDGEMTKIALMEDTGEFSPTTYPGRKLFKINEWSKTKGKKQKSWIHFKASGTELLNGVSQLMTFHKTEISIIK